MPDNFELALKEIVNLMRTQEKECQHEILEAKEKNIESGTAYTRFLLMHELIMKATNIYHRHDIDIPEVVAKVNSTYRQDLVKRKLEEIQIGQQSQNL